LSKLVDNKDISLEALKNAVHVLDNDPIYNPSLRSEEGEENEEQTNGEVKGNDIDWSTNSRRRTSVLEQHGMKPAKEKASTTQDRRRSSRRQLSKNETSIWQLALEAEIEDSDEDKCEKSGNSFEPEVGQAIDPLLTVVPVEPTSKCSHLEPSDDDKKKNGSTEPSGETLGGETSFGAGSNPKNPLAVCCGGMDCLNMTVGDLPEETIEVEQPQEPEFKTLELKMEYLHLTDHEKSQHSQLSTWIGHPDDYPLLGLERAREENEDPLFPHVVSPLLLRTLRDHLPFSLKEENFWLKYSLARDGASLEIILSSMRHSQNSILAIETSEGEVFGSFNSSPWRSNGNSYYGSCQAFVWQLRKPRDKNCQSLDAYILRESTLDIFGWNKNGNRNIQLSNFSKLFVGGGEPEVDEDTVVTNKEKKVVTDWGMAIALDRDLLHGTSSQCATFDSAPLMDRSRNKGSQVFEIVNIEIWTLTPCMNVETAQDLELGRTFVMSAFKKE